MITLYTFGPAFNLPDPSPFVTKAEMLLKLADVPYETDTDGFNKAPKGKLPYIRDGEELIGDSSFIRRHLEKKHGAVFDVGLNDAQKATAYAFEKLCEDNLYWTVVYERWVNDDNFNLGPRRFFDTMPAPVRVILTPLIRKKVVRDVKGQGMSRHSEDEIAAIAVEGLTALSDYLGEKPYFMGDTVTGADATVFSFVAGALSPHFRSRTLEVGGTYPNLVAYCDRLMEEFFPTYAKKA